MDVYLDVAFGSSSPRTLTIRLFDDVVPKTCDNFRTLCVDSKYAGSPFHRIIKGFMAQGGDFTRGDGTGGESKWGREFADENFTLKHDTRGLLSMANAGKNTNGSQFFILFGPAKHLDGKHVVFGKVVKGLEVVNDLERVEVDSSSNRPKTLITVMKCGVISTPKTKESSPNETRAETRLHKLVAKAKPSALLNPVAAQLDASLKRQSQVQSSVDASAQASSFPIPTQNKPNAVFVDDDASTKARLSAEKRTSSSELESDKLERLKREIEIAKRLNLDALANDEEEDEHDGDAKRSEPKSYLYDSIAAAERVASQAARKAHNIATKTGWVGMNEENEYAAHAKDVAKRRRRGLTLQTGDDDDLTAKEVEERLDSLENMTKKTKRIHGASHGTRSDAFSQSQTKFDGEASAELKQSLKRGTAL